GLLLLIISIRVNLGSRIIDFAIQAEPAAVLLNLTTMALGYFAGKALLHREAQARAISLEVGLQTGTLALLITTGILQSAEMSVAPSIYSLVMFISATLFTLWVLRQDRRRRFRGAAQVRGTMLPVNTRAARPHIPPLAFADHHR